MAEQSFWQRVIAAVNREYDRRIRRASLVSEYGASHHGEHHADHDDNDLLPHDDEAAIVNVPRGTPLGRRSPSPLPPETDSSS